MLAEDVLLCALDDEKGTVDWTKSSALPYGLAGALLAELALRERIAFEGKHVAVLDASPTGDDLLDEALALIAAGKKPRGGQHWVEKINGSVKKLSRRLEERLVARGVLRHEPRKELAIFPADRFPTVNPSPEREARERVRAALLGDEAPDDRTLALISLLNATGLLDGLFTKEERKPLKKRVKVIAEGESGAAGAAAKAASDAAAAVTAAVVAAAAAAGAVVSSS